jgi:hypothetical protein
MGDKSQEKINVSPPQKHYFGHCFGDVMGVTDFWGWVG